MNGFLEIDKLLHRLLLSESDLEDCKTNEKFKNFINQNGDFTLKSVKNFIINEDKSSSMEEEKVSKESQSSNVQESTKEDNDIDINDIDINDIDISELIEERLEKVDDKIDDVDDVQSDSSANIVEHEITQEAKFSLLKIVDSISIY